MGHLLDLKVPLNVAPVCCQTSNRLRWRRSGSEGQRQSGMQRWTDENEASVMLVSFTMQGWEGISLAYITLSPPSPPLTSPSPPPHTRSPPSLLRSQDVALAYLLFQCFGYLPLFCSPSSQKAGGGRKWGDHKDERWWRLRGPEIRKGMEEIEQELWM